jgi:hypothetical protein
VLIGGGALLGAAIVYGLRAAFSTSSPTRSGVTFTPTASASGLGLGAAGTF